MGIHFICKNKQLYKFFNVKRSRYLKKAFVMRKTNDRTFRAEQNVS